MDYTISEDATVLDAVQKFAAYNIGCLVTTDSNGTYTKRRREKKKHETYSVPEIHICVCEVTENETVFSLLGFTVSILRKLNSFETLTQFICIFAYF